jgi:hypothetical protein
MHMMGMKESRTPSTFEELEQKETARRINTEEKIELGRLRKGLADYKETEPGIWANIKRGTSHPAVLTYLPLIINIANQWLAAKMQSPISMIENDLTDLASKLSINATMVERHKSLLEQLATQDGKKFNFTNKDSLENRQFIADIIAQRPHLRNQLIEVVDSRDTLLSKQNVVDLIHVQKKQLQEMITQSRNTQIGQEYAHLDPELAKLLHKKAFFKNLVAKRLDVPNAPAIETFIQRFRTGEMKAREEFKNSFISTLENCSEDIIFTELLKNNLEIEIHLNEEMQHALQKEQTMAMVKAAAAQQSAAQVQQQPTVQG